MDDQPMMTCIRRPIKDNPKWFNECFTAYRMYKAGFLPNEGAYMDQTTLFTQVINIMDSALVDCHDINEGKAADKRKRQRQQLR